jgi:hypothetical protein
MCEDSSCCKFSSTARDPPPPPVLFRRSRVHHRETGPPALVFPPHRHMRQVAICNWVEGGEGARTAAERRGNKRSGEPRQTPPHTNVYRGGPGGGGGGTPLHPGPVCFPAHPGHADAPGKTVVAQGTYRTADMIQRQAADRHTAPTRQHISNRHSPFKLDPRNILNLQPRPSPPP